MSRSLNQRIEFAACRSPRARIVHAMACVVIGLIGLAGFDADVRAQVLLSGVVQVSDGSAHTCAVTSQGAAMCWGSSAAGELGDGSGMDHPQ